MNGDIIARLSVSHNSSLSGTDDDGDNHPPRPTPVIDGGVCANPCLGTREIRDIHSSIFNRGLCASDMVPSRLGKSTGVHGSINSNLVTDKSMRRIIAFMKI
jgi:hypothetical protein